MDVRRILEALKRVVDPLVDMEPDSFGRIKATEKNKD